MRGGRILVLVSLLAAVLTALLVGCGSAGNPDSGAVGSLDDPLTIDEALALGDADRVWVMGSLLILGDQTRLCSILAESYPPSCAGSSLVVEGLDPDAVVGLSRTNPDQGVSDALWSDFPVVLEGSLSDGALTVDVPPRPLGEATAGDLRLRFDHWPRPVPATGTVNWALDLTNTSGSELRLIFGSGQKGDVILSRGGSEAYRWSADMFFTEAIEELVLPPGGTYGFDLVGAMNLAPGEYELRAFCTASDMDLPEVSTVVTLE